MIVKMSSCKGNIVAYNPLVVALWRALNKLLFVEDIELATLVGESHGPRVRQKGDYSLDGPSLGRLHHDALLLRVDPKQVEVDRVEREVREERVERHQRSAAASS